MNSFGNNVTFYYMVINTIVRMDAVNIEVKIEIVFNSSWTKLTLGNIKENYCSLSIIYEYMLLLKKKDCSYRLEQTEYSVYTN